MTSAPADPVDLPFLARLLEADDDTHPRALLRKARAVSTALPQLLLSAARRDGLALGTGAADELRRAGERADTYREVFAAVCADVSSATVRQVKGASLAAHYPEGLRRPVGDLDLVVDGDEEDLWRVVAAVTAYADLTDVDLALLHDGSRTHLVLSLSWPSPDALLDRDLRVEVSTLAFPGRHPDVPPRARLPEEPFVADLLSLAEEAFQRPFHARDVVDVLFLFGAPPEDSGRPDPSAVAAAAGTLRLAPELLHLLTYSRDRVPPGVLGRLTAARLDAVTAALRGPVATERARRAAVVSDRPADCLGIDDRLASGLPVHGMPLRHRPFDAGLSPSRRHDFADGSLLRTPVADFLLVTGPLVAPEQYHSALRELDRIDPPAPGEPGSS
ncbi:hypothetical protein C3492_05365 [Streptomyces sp. Ru62]|uniref:hypothetical protein n=1 Tax=Streptomyces sp. Ru62 TaxID=2080745 RepID=UPI000CDE2893|nr:hypothetical protein [Streptomyces sp. Ru62]POX64462.1 hypothetical protein C3492_05365 [Streptomyces sp. Ru62]